MGSNARRLLAGIILAAGLHAAEADPCAVLSRDAIRKATGETVAAVKSGSQTAGKVRHQQCFYSLPTFANSISLTITSPVSIRGDAAGELWERWFGEVDEDRKPEAARKPESEEEEAAAKAVRVTGIGDEAYWVQSFVGNLYVRKGGRFLRISLGGKLTDDERQARAKALAADALKHWQ